MSSEGKSAPPSISTWRRLYWSIRRELWEHRSIYVAPLVVAMVALIGLVISTAGLPTSIRSMASMDVAQHSERLSMPYSVAALLLMATSVIVGCFYCLDALHGERRDRSILFWKSLPVSDATTVLAKASIPLVVLPLLTFAIATAVQIIMLIISTLVVLASGIAVTSLWSRLPLVDMPIGLIYFLIAMAFWYAPLYAWLLFVSAWAKRGTFVWAVIPPLAILTIQSTALQTTVFTDLAKSRLVGGFAQAFSAKAKDMATGEAARSGGVTPDPAKFLSSPELWIGLLVAALLIFAAIQLRRRREPI